MRNSRQDIFVCLSSVLEWVCPNNYIISTHTHTWCNPGVHHHDHLFIKDNIKDQDDDDDQKNVDGNTDGSWKLIYIVRRPSPSNRQ